MSLVKEAVMLRLLGAIKVHALHFATTITYMAYNIWHNGVLLSVVISYPYYKLVNRATFLKNTWLDSNTF